MPKIYDYPLKDIAGNDFDLKQFAGKKILLVNTASECGLTPQYAQLQEVYEQFKNKLVIVGLPSNDFGGQEPGTEKQIAEFCSLNYQVTFPLTQKVNIKSEPVSPIYEFLTKKELNGFQDSEVIWNFQKYLINEQGDLTAVFHPKIEVASEEFLKHIE